eukprot:gb/GEZN01013997.1/.p1 GENE.gb/GEZN01013997.1/~~gb/GEZN01013997.1/.p1  ORF type:complete len:184 (+),score=26.47 gb/GEZN01013997.1/:69-620(+)
MPGRLNIGNFLKGMAGLAIMGGGMILLPLAHLPSAYNPFDEEHRRRKLAEANRTLRRVHQNGMGRMDEFEELFPSVNLNPKRIFVPAENYFDAVWNWKKYCGYDMSRWGYYRAETTNQDKLPAKSPYDGLTPKQMYEEFKSLYPAGDAPQGEIDALRRALIEYPIKPEGLLNGGESNNHIANM